MSDEKKPAMVNVTVDGIPTCVPAGTNLIEAAKTVGVDIPHYCYHEGLSIAANCRMCLVETSNSPPGKLVPGCQIPVAEGQAITTTSQKVKEQQRAVEEFLLLNHPVDCAICDQAGECRLQDYFQEYDHKPSRLESPKWMADKRKDLGPLIVLDQERCINCTRCIRFMDEVAKDPALGMFHRGSRSVVDVFPGKVLDNNYSGNIVDICPVGALLNKDNRFRARAYFLTATPSLCTGCSRGCNTYLDHFQGVPYRYRPRENMEVNQHWMCDHGRLSYHALYQGRVEQAVVKGESADAKDASVAAAGALQSLAGTKDLAVVVSPVLSLEDALAVMLLAKEGLQASEVFVSGRADDQDDFFLMRADRNPNRKGVELAAAAFGLAVRPFAELQKRAPKGVLLAGVEAPTDAEAFGSWLAGVDQVVALAANHGPVAAAAKVLLPLATHAEEKGTFVNFEGRAQRFLPAYGAPGAAQAGWKWAAAILGELGFSYRYASAGEVFADLSKRLPEGALGDFDWNRAPRAVLKGVTPLTGGTVDGRPAGWRELVPLRTTSEPEKAPEPAA